MDCRDMKEQILESLEAVLAPVVKDQLQQYLIDCAECALPLPLSIVLGTGGLVAVLAYSL